MAQQEKETKKQAETRRKKEQEARDRDPLNLNYIKPSADEIYKNPVSAKVIPAKPGSAPKLVAAKKPVDTTPSIYANLEDIMKDQVKRK